MARMPVLGAAAADLTASRQHSHRRHLPGQRRPLVSPLPSASGVSRYDPLPETRPFAEKVVAVTGAGSGIGRALSYAFAERGANLALNDINSAAVIETADGVRARGQQATYKVFDVTDATEFIAFAHEAVAAYGRVDI